MRYFLKIAYNGAEYHGWQVQPNVVSVQGAVQSCIAQILQLENFETMGCGRTDTGVHAKEFYLHFDLEKPPIDNFVFRLNRRLPDDIIVYDLIELHDDAHVRFDAVSRTYEYHLHQQKNAFRKNLSAYIPSPLNVDKMNAAAAMLLDHTDFRSFCKAHSEQKTTNCDVRFAQWTTNGDALCFTITADRFLRNMVRAIVGTLVDIGRGKLEVEDMETIIKAKDRSSAGTSVLACGLYLTRIEYPYLNKSE